MTTTTATNNSPQQSILSALNGTGSGTTTPSATQSAQDRFLKLLTVQLQNQDPLNPLDNAQMTSQLAQISTVDGITQLNATMQAMMNSFSASQNMQAAALVGHGVIVPGNGLSLQQGTPAIGGVDLASAASNVTVTITDANGLTVRTMNLGALKAGSNDFQWDGKDDGGAPAASGSYTFSVAAAQNGQKVTATALQLGVVSSVSLGSKGATLDVGSLGSFSLSDVKQII
jgi:flagellar basal-body rod modification protein FlgD